MAIMDDVYINCEQQDLNDVVAFFEAACKDVDDLRKEATPKKGLGRRGPGRVGRLGGQCVAHDGRHL